MRICTIQSCGRTHYAKGFCRTHYTYYNSKPTYRQIDNHKCDAPDCQKNVSSLYKYCQNHRKKIARGYAFNEKGSTRGSRNGRWAGGTSDYPNHYELKKNRLIKLQQCNGKCELCGNTAKQVHHLDKSKNNHAIDNLQALCYACHRKTYNDHCGRKRKYGNLTLQQMADIIGCSCSFMRTYWKKILHRQAG